MLIFQSFLFFSIFITAKQFAEKVLEEQKLSFQRWGVMGDWNNVYRTLSSSYEAKQLEIFYKIYEKVRIVAILDFSIL